MTWLWHICLDWVNYYTAGTWKRMRAEGSVAHAFITLLQSDTFAGCPFFSAETRTQVCDLHMHSVNQLFDPKIESMCAVIAVAFFLLTLFLFHSLTFSFPSQILDPVLCIRTSELRPDH